MLRVLNTGMLRESQIETDGPAVRLGEAGRRALLDALEGRLDQTAHHDGLRREIAYAPHRLSSIVGRRESKEAMSPIAGTAPVHDVPAAKRTRFGHDGAERGFDPLPMRPPRPFRYLRRCPLTRASR